MKPEDAEPAEPADKIKRRIVELEKEKEKLINEFKGNLDAFSNSNFSQNAMQDIGELIHVNFGKAMRQYEYIIGSLQWAIGEEDEEDAND